MTDDIIIREGNSSLTRHDSYNIVKKEQYSIKVASLALDGNSYR